MSATYIKTLLHGGGDLQKILVDHKLWCDTEGREGTRANLMGANLRGADLWGANLADANLRAADLADANLRGAIGDMTYIKSLQLDTWPITYTSERMQIGCQNHTIEAWWAFSDEAIARMDFEALTWWRRNRSYIRFTLENYPAKPTTEGA